MSFRLIKHLNFMIVCAISISIAYSTSAQVRPSPTPIIVNLVTPTPFSVQQAVATVTPTFTPTPIGPVLLEAREAAGSVNIRAEPDPNSERLGSISFGTQYPVLRQYFSWYELQYDLSPSGRAWVYGELVDIVGDITAIQIVDTLEIEPTQNLEQLQATETWNAITSAPGGAQTATASARVLNVPTEIAEIPFDNVQESIVLPTFTYPADTIALVPTEVRSEGSRSPSNNETRPIPPLFPIVLLGGFGIIGLLFNSLRR